jgi:hypothetical protein
MPEASMSQNTNQEILKDVVVGRNFNLRNLEVSILLLYRITAATAVSYRCKWN